MKDEHEDRGGGFGAAMTRRGGEHGLTQSLAAHGQAAWSRPAGGEQEERGGAGVGWRMTGRRGAGQLGVSRRSGEGLEQDWSSTI
jgi:hypothetical protein